MREDPRAVEINLRAAKCCMECPNSIYRGFSRLMCTQLGREVQPYFVCDVGEKLMKEAEEKENGQ